MPTRETLEHYLRACGVPRGQLAGWLAARERAASATFASLEGMTRVERADPRRLGVHRAINAPGATGMLPVYISRDADDGSGGVRALVSRASCQGGLIVLVGGSSAGSFAVPLRRSGP